MQVTEWIDEDVQIDGCSAGGRGSKQGADLQNVYRRKQIYYRNPAGDEGFDGA